MTKNENIECRGTRTRQRNAVLVPRGSCRAGCPTGRAGNPFHPEQFGWLVRIRSGWLAFARITGWSFFGLPRHVCAWERGDMSPRRKAASCRRSPNLAAWDSKGAKSGPEGVGWTALACIGSHLLALRGGVSCGRTNEANVERGAWDSEIDELRVGRGVLDRVGSHWLGLARPACGTRLAAGKFSWNGASQGLRLQVPTDLGRVRRFFASVFWVEEGTTRRFCRFLRRFCRFFSVFFQRPPWRSGAGKDVRRGGASNCTRGACAPQKGRKRAENRGLTGNRRER
jgi:hypothetical protein